MSSPSPATAPPGANHSRHALPALIFLLVLCLLTGLIWWRVITRDNDTRNASKATDCSTVAPTKPSTLPLPSTITIVVYNSTPKNGLAAKVAKTLKSRGFKVPDKAANDPRGKLIPGVGEIRYGSAAAAAAATVLFYIPGATMVATDSADSTVAVSIGDQFTKLPSADQAKVALQAAGVTLVTPAPAVGVATDNC